MIEKVQLPSIQRRIPEVYRRQFRNYAMMDPTPFQLFVDYTYNAVIQRDFYDQSVLGDAIACSGVLHVHNALQISKAISTINPELCHPSQHHLLEQERTMYQSQLEDQIRLAQMAIDIEVAQDGNVEYMPLISDYLYEHFYVGERQQNYYEERGWETQEIIDGLHTIVHVRDVYFGKQVEGDEWDTFITG